MRFTMALTGAAVVSAASIPRRGFFDEVKEQLDDFREDFEDMIEDAMDLDVFESSPMKTISSEEAWGFHSGPSEDEHEHQTQHHGGPPPSTGGHKAGPDSFTSMADDDNDGMPTTPGNGTEPTGPFAKCSSEPQKRVEWRSMSAANQQAYLDSVVCLMDRPSMGGFKNSTSRYEDLIVVHQSMNEAIHQSQIFLLWHRYYLHTFSMLLRHPENCGGYKGPLPYWDETLDAGNFAASPLFTPQAFGTLGQAYVDQNGHTKAPCVQDGAFANRTLHIGPGPPQNNTRHCLQRAVNDDSSKECNNDFINACNAKTAYPDMHDCHELGPHAHGHIAVGGVMREVSASPGDNTFFLHHAWVDSTFKQWQDMDPETRTSTISGCADRADPATNSCTPLTLDTVLTSQGIRPDVTVRDILRADGEHLCYEYE